jgi:cyclic pyranopterin phosphate synthase
MMIDPFGRGISYVRVSVTDRCDFRCVYCMAENMTFLPKKDLLSLEELDRLCSAFIDLGVRKIRLTGGEPLVRRNIMSLIGSLQRHLDSGALDELTLTTNGSQLGRHAQALHAHGVRRVNVSLDTLDPAKFLAITRWGKYESVMDGIAAAKAAGLHLKINMVALQGVNEDEFDRMIAWCGAEGFDLTMIETMPSAPSRSGHRRPRRRASGRPGPRRRAGRWGPCGNRRDRAPSGPRNRTGSGRSTRPGGHP